MPPLAPADARPYTPPRMTSRATKTVCSVATLAILASSCSEGGDEDRPIGEVQIARDHHIAAILGRISFAQFPVDPAEVDPFDGFFEMREDGNYSLRSAGSQLIEDQYALEMDGELAVVQRRNNASSLVYRGAYGLEGETGNVFFTDRVTDRVGLFVGVPRVTGAADPAAIAGDWRLHTLSVIYPGTNTVASVNNVGRAFVGTATIATDGTFTGSGSESLSPAAALPISGSLTAFQDGAFTSQVDFGSSARDYAGGGGPSLIVLADDSESAGGAGLAVWMRERTGAIDLTALAGIYDIGAWVLRVNPNESGFDSLYGSIEFTAGGAFRIASRDNMGDPSDYEGTFSATDQGALTLNATTPVPAEAWLGTVDQGYDTIVFVDNRLTNGENPVALRMFVAVRRKSV